MNPYSADFDSQPSNLLQQALSAIAMRTDNSPGNYGGSPETNSLLRPQDAGGFPQVSGQDLIKKYMAHLYAAGPDGTVPDQAPQQQPQAQPQADSFDDRWNQMALGSDPFAVAAQRFRNSQHPMLGRKEGDTLNPASMLGTAASAVLPQMAGTRLLSLVSRFPKIAAALGGGAGAMAATGTDPAPAADSTADWWRTPRSQPPQAAPFSPPLLTPEEEAQFKAPAADATRRKGEGPMAYKERMAREGNDASTMLDKRGAFLDQKVAAARKDYEAANAQAQAQYDAEQARLDKHDNDFKIANQSFREAHPTLSAALQMGGSGLGFGIPYYLRTRALNKSNTVANGINDATDAGVAALTGRGAEGTALRQQALARLRGNISPENMARMENKASEPGWGYLAGSMGAGGLEGSLGAVAPYIVDKETLPFGAHGREEADDWNNWLSRGASGAVTGAAAGYFGGRLPLLKSDVVPRLGDASGLMESLAKQAPRAASNKAPATAASTATRKTPRKPRKKPAAERPDEAD